MRYSTVLWVLISIAVVTVGCYRHFSALASPPSETSIRREVRYCLPPPSGADEIEYVTSFQYKDSVFHSFYIHQKLPVYFEDNLEEVVRRLVIRVDDVGCSIVMPVEKSEDSMTLYLPDEVAYGLLQRELQAEIDGLGGLDRYVDQLRREEAARESLDEMGDSANYILPEFVEACRRLGIPLPEAYTVIHSLTEAPEYIPWHPSAPPESYPEDSVEGRPSKKK